MLLHWPVTLVLPLTALTALKAKDLSFANSFLQQLQRLAFHQFEQDRYCTEKKLTSLATPVTPVSKNVPSITIVK
ncbi:hypothetical protein AO070_18835 [Pseudomonas syringae pv. syringae PD2766]|nr:hypothetical protein AO070_18835 [Pseudomonas syringae pv. syringae PD2766]